MQNEPNLPKAEYLKIAVNDLIDLIDRANKAIERHSQEPKDELAIEQYQDLKDDYTRQLVELLKQLDVVVQLPTDKAA